MQTYLSDQVKASRSGALADDIIRKCVHCGFCNVTCPSYQIVGNELDGPRGRIYLIKRALEEGQPGRALRDHLDTCLTCRACETTCPAGVRYAELLEIGRELAEQGVPRRWTQNTGRWVLRQLLSHRRLFAVLVRAGRIARPLLPGLLRRQLPEAAPAQAWPAPRYARRVLLLGGCVQDSLDPAIDTSAAQILDQQEMSPIRVPGSGCCGALSLHLSAGEEARRWMRRNIDACWPYIESGAEAIVSTASGCGATLKDYARLLADDPLYAEKAARFTALVKDIAEMVEPASLPQRQGEQSVPVVFHSPCSLQHGQRLTGRVEAILSAAGATITPLPEAHLCCGAAGTYALLQPRISKPLVRRKLDHIAAMRVDTVLTANIGCQVHLQGHGDRPVRHWITWLAERVGAVSETQGDRSAR